MRKLFLTGLITLLPVAITLIIVSFILNLITGPFEGTIEWVLSSYDILDKPFLILTGPQVLSISSKLLALTAILALIVGIGILGQMVLATAFFSVRGKAIERIPLIRTIYKIARDAVNALFGSKGSSFAQVVLVPYPHEEAICIGFLSKRMDEQDQAKEISVFLPGAPNPTFGFMLTYPKEQIVVADMTVEEAFKFIVSAGMAIPETGQRRAVRTSRTP